MCFSLLCYTNHVSILAKRKLRLFTQKSKTACRIVVEVAKRFETTHAIIAHADGVEVSEGVGVSIRWWIQADVCAEILSGVAPNAAAVRRGPFAGVHPREHQTSVV
jgi:hypothetical protein